MADQRSEPILAESVRPTAVAIPAPVAVSVPGFRRPRRLGQLLERQDILAVVLLAPALVILTLFIAYPFVLGIWLAISDKVVGRPGAFVGLENFRVNLNDSIFLRAFQNTFVYTFIATFFKLAMGCLIAVNVWRGMPFFAITLLAGLQTVNPDLHEAAEIDGANAWQRFWRVTLPLIKPIMLVVVLFSMIATFADFQLIYVLTRGGPYSSTHVFGTYAYEIAMRAAKLGQGASISLSLFPFLLAVIVFQLWYIRRSD